MIVFIFYVKKVNKKVNLELTIGGVGLSYCRFHNHHNWSTVFIIIFYLKKKKKKRKLPRMELTKTTMFNMIKSCQQKKKKFD